MYAFETIYITNYISHESYDTIAKLEALEAKGARLLEVHIIKLRENEAEAHYCYVFITTHGVIVNDSPTDYSGTGSRIKRELDEYIAKRGIKPQLHEWDFSLYWLLRNIFMGWGR